MINSNNNGNSSKNHDVEFSPLVGPGNSNIAMTSTRVATGLSQRQSSYLSTGNNINNRIDDSNDEYDKHCSRQEEPHHRMIIIRMVLELLYGAIIFALGWFVPRYYIYNETTIQQKIPPYQVMASSGDLILDSTLNYPLVAPPMIPSDFLVHTSVHIPILFVAIITYLFHPMEENILNCNESKNKLLYLRWYKVCSSVSGILTAIGICECITQCLKLFIQRPRPNYYALCGFDITTKQCTGTVNHVREANFSFPSGHSSLSACSMVYLTWFLLAKIHILFHLLSLKSQTKARKTTTTLTSSSLLCCTLIQQRIYLCLLICIVFPGWSVFVGATRLVDKWHHYSDVIAGLLLGSICSTIVYHMWYPPLLFYLMPSAASGGDTNSSSMIVSIPWTILSFLSSSSRLQQHQAQQHSKMVSTATTCNTGGVSNSTVASASIAAV